MDRPSWLDVGSRVEVRWEVGADSSEPQRCYSATCLSKNECSESCFTAVGRSSSDSEPQTKTIWWPATVARRDGTHTLTDDDTAEKAILPVYVLQYDPDESMGWEGVEECWTCFVGFHRILDVKYGESCLYYRKEGDNWEPDELEDLMEAVGKEDPGHLTLGAPLEMKDSAEPTMPDGDWVSMGTSDAKAAAEELANTLMSSLQSQYEEMARTVPHDVQLRAALKLGKLRERFIEALHEKFEQGVPLTVEVARSVIDEIQQDGARDGKRARMA